MAQSDLLFSRKRIYLSISPKVELSFLLLSSVVLSCVIYRFIYLNILDEIHFGLGAISGIIFLYCLPGNKIFFLERQQQIQKISNREKRMRVVLKASDFLSSHYRPYYILLPFQPKVLLWFVPLLSLWYFSLLSGFFTFLGFLLFAVSYKVYYLLHPGAIPIYLPWSYKKLLPLKEFLERESI